MPRVASFASVCCLSIGLLGAGTARAQPSGLGPSDLRPATEERSRSAAAEREADALLERAKAHFRTSQFREALPLIERALALTDSPRFLFNLGVLHHKLSECVLAREYFQRYLERDPAGAARQQTLEALDELNARCPDEPPGVHSGVQPTVSARVAEEAPAATLPPPPHAPAPPRGVAQSSSWPGEPPAEPPREASWSPPPNALVLMGLGAAIGVGTAVTLTLQGRAQREVDALGPRAAQEHAPWDEFEAERRELSAHARLYRGLSIGLGVACAALVGAGVTLWVLETSPSPGLYSAGVGVGYGGPF